MRHAALGVLVLLLTGCATLMGGPTEEINISSSPAGARIIVDGQDRGQTPQVIRFSRFRAPEIYLVRDGCEPYAVQVNRNFRGKAVVLGNFFLPPLSIAGAVVDLGTGSAFDLSPNTVVANLVCK